MGCRPTGCLFMSSRDDIPIVTGHFGVGMDYYVDRLLYVICSGSGLRSDNTLD